MSFEWDNEVVDKFLKEYRQHECLWNPYHRNFTDCYARNEALRKIVRALRADLTVEDCLKILRCIRAKYLEEQTKSLTRRLRPPRSRWLCMVESMLEKIVRDEEGEDVKEKSKKQLEPKVKTLYRHTISSSNRRKDCAVSLVKSKSTGNCPRGKSFGKGKGRKKSKKNSRGKLDKGSRFCSDVEKTKERNSCKRSDMQDCSRPQTAWGRQRENYLDNLKWTTYDGICARTLECPAYSSHLDRISRVENICKDPCSLPATTYQCQTRSNPPTASCNWEGRKRNNDIQPTPPSVIEARNCRVTRPTSSCSERRTPSSQDTSCPAAPEKRSRSCKDKDKPTMKTASTSCCPCPEKTTTEKPKQCETTMRANTESAQMPDVCTKETCPNFSKSTTTVTCPEKRYTSNIVPLESSNKCIGTFDCSKNVRFDCNQDLQQCVTGFQTTPRVAAKFENGVLEAYSQFKVIFPTRLDSNMSSANNCRESSSASLKAPAPVKKVTQRVQTDSTTRDCAVSVNSSEFLCPSRPQSAKSSCCPNRCLSQRNMQIGTDDDIVEVCYQDNAPASLEAEKTLHDFVLLTPGGKYVPLVRSDANEKMQVFAECCADGNRPAERVPDVCETAPSRNREKRMQNPLDDEKCDSSTTKLLLRCLEQMLNLEEQEEKGKSGDTQEDPCEPCKRKELAEKAALGCPKEKPTNPRIDLGCPSPRGKLTQNFLEILKCALELDNGKKTDLCDDDGQKQDKNCDCDDFVPEKTEPPTPKNFCGIENRNCDAQGDRMIRCQLQTPEELANKSEVSVPLKEHKSVPCQEFPSSTQPINIKASPGRDDAPVIRSCAVDSNPLELSRLQPRATSPNSTSGDKQVSYKKTLKQTNDGHSKILEKTVAYKEASTSGTCIGSPVTKDAGVQEKTLSASTGTQCESRRRETKTSKANSVGTQKRDTVLEYLVKCANRPDKISPIRPSPRTSKSPTPNRIITEKSRTNLPPDQCQQDNGTRVSYVKCDQFYRSYVVRSPTRLTATPQENADAKLKEYHRRVCALKKIYDSGH